MAVNDLEIFVNFYKIKTILDPNADVLLKNTIMDELLVWKTYRWKNVNKLCIAEEKYYQKNQLTKK